MTRHTPGPWRVIPPDCGGKPAVQRGTEGGFLVAGFDADREMADANLIAAAPDEHAALKECQAVLHELVSGDPKQSAMHIWARCVAAESKARTAIMKAEGRRAARTSADGGGAT